MTLSANGPISRCRFFIFDLDDTLYPELEYLRSGFRAVARWCTETLAVDGPATNEELNALFCGGYRRDTFDKWVENHGLARNTAVEMLAVYREHSPEIEPFPGTREMLAELRRRSKVGLLSDGILTIQQRKLAALGIQNMFDVVIFSDQLGRDSWKPSRRPYLLALEAAGVSPSEAVYVGDNPTKDFIACRQLGMPSVRIQQKGGVYAELVPESESHAPDFVAGSIDHLRALLDA